MNLNEDKEKKDPPKKKIKLPPMNNNGGKNNLKTLAIWLLIILAALYLTQVLLPGMDDDVKITYSEFRRQLEKNNIEKVEFVGKDVYGFLRTESTTAVKGEMKTYSKFKLTLLPTQLPDNEVLSSLLANDVVVDVREKGFSFMNLIIMWFPWLLFIGIWFFIMRQMQGGGGQKGIFSFGKSKARLLNADRVKVTFDDVAGADEAKTELKEIIEFLKDPGKFTKIGGKIPKGALLLGPPGTGKTLLAKAVAGEAKVPFFSMSGSDFVEMFVGVGASRVRDLFESGKKNAPCILFIDEIDAVGRQRGAGLGGGHDEREQTLNQLLVEMDGFESNEGVILIAATNRPDVLDSALLRPGRFDRQIVVDRPDVKGREGILKVHTKNIKVNDDVDLEIIAKGTPGMSGADLANLVNEAALLAARKNKENVDMHELEEAKDKVMMGAERRSMTISDKEKEVISYHESGHVLVAKHLEHSDPIHKVTIIPRGRALGVTHSLPDDDRHLYTKNWALHKISQLLGGRIAEKITFGEISSGASNDIEVATKIARMMVCEWGMSDKLGPLALGKKQEEIFLGREISTHRDYSESTALSIDNEVKSIISKCYDEAYRILTDYNHQLESLSKELLKKEILTADEIDDVMKKARPKRKSPVKRKSSPKARVNAKEIKEEKRNEENKDGHKKTTRKRTVRKKISSDMNPVAEKKEVRSSDTGKKTKTPEEKDDNS